ncbi:MAG: monovalent cation/H(+) antiporter subunit G [Nitrospirales bacterium]|nr:monovalent cation/H(+) antiporter subunit G [Nitrospinota bacterium]
MVVLASVFIFLGLVFLLIAAIGMVRLPDVYTRSHAVGLTDTWGAFFMLLGLALYQGFSLNAVKILVVLILLLFLGTVISHATVRAALRSGLKPWSKVQE